MTVKIVFLIHDSLDEDKSHHENYSTILVMIYF